MKYLKALFVAALFAVCGLANALTPAQALTLKAAINANPTWAAFPLSDDGYFDLARALNAVASPTFTVWRTSVPLADVGQSFNSTELAGLTTANTNRLQVMAQFSGGYVNPSKADVRAGYDSVYSGAGGVLTRAALLILWKRPATFGEKALATGTGTDAVPATLTFEGQLTPDDVRQARNS